MNHNLSGNVERRRKERQQSVIPTGIYEAQLRKIRLNKLSDISQGAAAWFWIPVLEQTVKYYIKPIEEDLSFSLKNFTYFLDYPYNNREQYYHQQLLGRYCQLKIESISSNGRQYPRIRDFAFSTRQLFENRGNGYARQS